MTDKFFGYTNAEWEGRIKPFTILYQIDDMEWITKTGLQGEEFDLLEGLDPMVYKKI